MAGRVEAMKADVWDGIERRRRSVYSAHQDAIVTLVKFVEGAIFGFLMALLVISAYVKY